jgi:hypothetical protein
VDQNTTQAIHSRTMAANFEGKWKKTHGKDGRQKKDHDRK